MKYLSLFFLFLLQLSAEIFETNEIATLETTITPHTFLILDIDNTLIEPAQTLGTDQWFYSQMLSYERQGYSKKEALNQTIKEWSAIQNLTEVKPVEPNAFEVIDRIQKNGITVIGLTARGLNLIYCTADQLNTVGIDLSRNAPTQDEVFFQNGKGVLFSGGILYCAGTHKGNALFKFLSLIGHTPSAVVFIDDKLSGLREVELACENRHIPFIGLRYSRTDHQVKNFSRPLADIQFKHFGRLMSDQEAEALLAQ
ncbi:MAG: DUF2608 domain-containing protein [Parachlamydiaceae bacterium]